MVGWCATTVVISRPADGHCILLNQLDIAVVNALVVWLCNDPTRNTSKSRLFFCENWVFANLTANGTSSNTTRNVFGGELSGKGIFSGKCPGVMYGGIVWAGKYPGKNVREKCWDRHAGLQVCTCSGYDLCHHGYIAYRQTQLASWCATTVVIVKTCRWSLAFF